MSNVEIWRDIEGYEGHYQISNHGRVKTLKNSGHSHAGAIRKVCPDNKGYLRIGLTKDCKPATFKVHHLVASAFIGKRPEGYQVNHKDGNKQNNHVANLEYTTNKANMRHAIENGLRDSIDFTGSRNPAAKLEEIEVRRIKHMLRDTLYSQREIGDLFGVEKSIISLINTGKNWREVQIDNEPLAYPITTIRKRNGKAVRVS